MAKVVGFDESAKNKVTCRSRGSRAGCGAIIEYDARDVQTYHGRDISGGADGEEWVPCPNCGSKAVIRSW